MDEILSRVTEFAQTGVLVVLVIWALRCAAKYPKPWLFQLMAGAFSCFLLGNLYLMLHVWIMDDWAFVFSPADISWLGLYGFLIAIDTGLISEWTQEERQRAKSARRLAWIGPVVVIVFHIANHLLYSEIWLNNLVFCIVLSILGYYGFYLFFASREKMGIQVSMNPYHTVILLFLITELILFLVSSFGYYPLLMYYTILAVLTVWLWLLVPAAKKGVRV